MRNATIRRYLEMRETVEVTVEPEMPKTTQRDLAILWDRYGVTEGHYGHLDRDPKMFEAMKAAYSIGVGDRQRRDFFFLEFKEIGRMWEWDPKTYFMQDFTNVYYGRIYPWRPNLTGSFLYPKYLERLIENPDFGTILITEGSIKNISDDYLPVKYRATPYLSEMARRGVPFEIVLINTNNTTKKCADTLEKFGNIHYAPQDMAKISQTIIGCSKHILKGEPAPPRIVV